MIKLPLTLDTLRAWQPARRQSARRACWAVTPLALPLLLTAAAMQFTGCANYPRTQAALEDSTDRRTPGAVSDPLAKPSQDGFIRLVRTYCGEFRVGSEKVRDLVSNATVFERLTLSLYHGNLTNDQYLRRVQDEYPSPTGNIEATGCVVNQLQKCFGERCDLPAAERRLPERNPSDDMNAYGSAG